MKQNTRITMADLASRNDPGPAYDLVSTASGWAVRRISDGAIAEFLSRREADEALTLLVGGTSERDYDWYPAP